MHTLTPTDLNFVIRRIPQDIRMLLKDLPLFLAGGFIRETIAGGDVKDIDLFGDTKLSLQSTAHVLASKRQTRPHETDNAITVLAPPRLPVQFITRWCFAKPEDVVASFDFTVCQAVVWYERTTHQWLSMVGDGFYPDLAARRLVYTFPVREEEAGGSMMRVRKFLARGYNIQADSLGGVIARMAMKVRETDLPLGRFDNDRERAFASVMSGLLREVDPLLVVDGLEPINEHEVA